MIVTGYNPEIDELERTYLSTQHSAGVSLLYVKNNHGFLPTRSLLIGEMGAEHSEVVTSTAPVGTTQIGTATPTKFSHEPDDPVTLLEYNRIAFYRSDSKDGTYTLVDTVDLDVDNADNVTRYDDANGTTTSWYKIKYVDSFTSEESDFSDPMQSTGYTQKTIGNVIAEVIRRVRDPNYSVLDMETYIDIANEVNDDLITQHHKPFRFLRTSTVLNTVAGQNYVELPADLWKYDRVEFTHTIGGVSTSSAPNIVTLADWDRKYNSSLAAASDELRTVAIDEANHRLYLGPTPLAGTVGKIELFYWRTFPHFNGLSYEVLTPNTLIYKYKMLAEYYHAKSESDNQFARLANTYESKYGAEVVKMVRVNGLDAGTPMQIKPQRGYRKYYRL